MRIKVSPSQPTPQERDLNFEGNYDAFLDITPATPGDFKVEVIRYDESGKEIDKKSGTFSAEGSAPTPANSAEPKKDDDSDEDK